MPLSLKNQQLFPERLPKMSKVGVIKEKPSDFSGMIS
jgi:hypothetical protein